MSRFLGKLPSGARLERIKASPQYQAGKFTNQSFTPDLAEDATMWKVLRAYRNKPATVKPAAALPIQEPDFSSMPADEPALIWFGHSSYYLQFEGLKILVNPVFSAHDSPVPGMVKAFAGADLVKPADLPDLNYVLITHDHYDHLDYPTILQLKAKTAHWITSLGVGAHLEYWGIPADKITELDWWESFAMRNGCNITAAPARHFWGVGSSGHKASGLPLCCNRRVTNSTSAETPVGMPTLRRSAIASGHLIWPFWNVANTMLTGSIST